ncbi:ANTAR domain-containing protein [Streptacidiphilus sp. EB129]|uniref:GAF and ANTAR domain-containing protein n=1 Tax=Streptacidiphilus sp. EB129 TaxID=3156262 RepID=UPI0035193019
MTHGHLTSACATVLNVHGVAVSLVIDGGATALVACSPGAARRFEELEFTLGEGPGPDAIRLGRPVFLPDLTQDQGALWPTLVPECMGLDIQAVFCFPLCVGTTAIGVLTAVRTSPGPMTDQENEDALGLAAALTLQLLGGERHPYPTWISLNVPAVQHREIVHQATGILSVQLMLPPDEALIVLRAFAYASERTLWEVARDVVSRRVRLAEEAPGHTSRSSGTGQGSPCSPEVSPCDHRGGC